MLKKDEIIDYINEKLTGLDLFEYRKEESEYKLIGLFNNKYTISVREINYNNIRCELNKKVLIDGIIFAGEVYTSCVISDWNNDQYKVLDSWMDNMLLIPNVKLKIKINKLKKIINKINETNDNYEYII